ncbi:MAG: hypothetical protein KF901_09175 [Myxococcales bacterium]|nr:hypothetical protein [Myxococcales bacterium]
MTRGGKGGAKDPLARGLAAAALAVALAALVLAGYAVSLGHRYLEDVQTLGDVLGRGTPASTGLGPPPTLDE